MRRSESYEQLTTAQADRSYESVTERPNVPNVEFRGERRPVEQSDSEESTFDPHRLLQQGSKQIIRLFVPVSLCMLLVVIMTCTATFYQTDSTQTSIYTPFNTKGASTSKQIGEGIANALIFVCVIIAATILLVVLFKYRCTKIIYGWIIFTSVILLFFFSFLFFLVVTSLFEVFVDYITFVLFIWNLGITGMMSIYWKAPLLVQQIALILMSSQMALFLGKVLPEWTTWFILAFLAVWDLVAVLCPKGPLRILVETMEERQEPLPPALVYNTAHAMMADAPGLRDNTNVSNPRASSNTAASPSSNTAAVSPNTAATDRAEEEEDGGFTAHVLNSSRAERVRAQEAASVLNGADDPASNDDIQISRTARNLRDIGEEVLSRDERGVKLGLGDFVFYSVLIGAASRSLSWSTILAVYVSVLIGMCSTLLLLAIRGHALPALPISIFFGLVFYFCTHLIISPFTGALAASQVFI